MRRRLHKRYLARRRLVQIVDESRCELSNAMPLCPHCGGLVRPNILMFGDWN